MTRQRTVEVVLSHVEIGLEREKKIQTQLILPTAKCLFCNFLQRPHVQIKIKKKNKRIFAQSVNDL